MVFKNNLKPNMSYSLSLTPFSKNGLVIPHTVPTKNNPTIFIIYYIIYYHYYGFAIY